MHAGHQQQVLAHQIYEPARDENPAFGPRISPAQVSSLAAEALSRIAARTSDRDDDRPLTGQPIVGDAPARQLMDVRIDELCQALLSPNQDAGLAIITTLRATGLDVESVYLEYLSVAADRLGDWWNDGRASFAQVTIGTSRIYAIMRSMDHLFATPIRVPQKSALFAAVPGETHTLGVGMAADLLRRSGWDITLRVGLSHDELVESIRLSEPRIIGLSSGGAHSAPALARLVVALRHSNPSACIMIGGTDLRTSSKVVIAMGADAVAADFLTARAEMERLWNKVSQPLAAS